MQGAAATTHRPPAQVTALEDLGAERWIAGEDVVSLLLKNSAAVAASVRTINAVASSLIAGILLNLH